MPKDPLHAAEGIVMPHRKISIAVGLLFLSSTLTFLIGSSLVEEYFSRTPQEGSLLEGVLLEGYTGLAVASIGVLLRPVLAPHGRRLSTGYLVLRAAECVAIISAGVYFMTGRESFESYDLPIYVLSGAGGLVLSYLLMTSGLVARWLSSLGLVGYAALLVGVAGDLLGIIDLNSGAGMAFYVPGGLFELVLPLLLIFKGFSNPASPGSLHRGTRAGSEPEGIRG
uniref:DUF4386 domain-containing protein n=1 Tax=Streptomyces sp. NBC_00003 TaxID=2903608 RepID=A0AAU2UYG1_9ACTN